MYIITYVYDDAFCTIECNNKDTANREYKELLYDPAVSELEACVRTVDVKFTPNGKVYTYFTKVNLSGYTKVITPSGETLQIVKAKLRSPQELKAMAQSRGFSYSQFKVLHGTAIK